MTTDEIAFDAVYQGTGSDGDNWEHNLWRVTLTVDSRTFSTDYRTGMGIVDLIPVGAASGEQQAKRLGGKLKYSALGPGKDAVAVPRAPTRNEVLDSLRLDCQAGDQLFEDFCADFGYDADSRKAHATWEACQKMHYELRNLFGYGRYQEFIDTDWEESCSSD